MTTNGPVSVRNLSTSECLSHLNKHCAYLPREEYDQLYSVLRDYGLMGAITLLKDAVENLQDDKARKHLDILQELAAGDPPPAPPYICPTCRARLPPSEPPPTRTCESAGCVVEICVECRVTVACNEELFYVCKQHGEQLKPVMDMIATGEKLLRRSRNYLRSLLATGN